MPRSRRPIILATLGVGINATYRSRRSVTRAREYGACEQPPDKAWG